MSDSSSEPEAEGAPPSDAPPPSRLRRWFRALVRVLVPLGCLAALALGVLRLAPGWVLRRGLGYARAHLPAGVRLEVTTLEAEHLGAPELSDVRVGLVDVGEVRARRVSLRLPVEAVTRRVLGLDESSPLAARLRIEGLEVRALAAAGMAVTAATVSLAATAPVVAHLEVGGIEVLHEGAEVLSLDAVVARAPWRSLLLGRPDVTSRVGPGRLDMAAARRAAGALASRGEAAEEAEAELLARLEELRVHDLAITTGNGGPTLWLDTLEALHGRDPAVLLPEVTATVRVEGGGHGRLTAAPDETGQRVAAEVALVGFELGRLPLPLPEDLAVAGAFDADLHLDLALATPADLARSRGTFALRGARLERAGVALAREGDLEIAIQKDRIRVNGRLGELTPVPGASLRQLELAGVATPVTIDVESLRARVEGGGRLEARGRVGRDSTGQPTKVEASLEVMDVPGTRLGLPESLGEPTLGLTVATTATVADPLHLRAEGTLVTTGLAPVGEALPPLAVPFVIRPEGIRVGPVALDLAGIGAEASLEVTRAARLRVRAQGARFQVPRLGPVELALRGRATAEPGLARLPGEAVLALWIRALQRPDWLDRLGLRWRLAELAVTGEEGPLLALEDAVGGALEPADGRAHLEPIDVEVLDAQFHVGGVVGARRQDALRVELEGVPLLRLVDLAVPDAQVAVAGTFGADLRLGALLGVPRADGTLSWRDEPGVSLWQRQGPLIRRLGLAMPDQDWRVALEPGALEVDGTYLDLVVPVPPKVGAMRVELSSFPVRVQSKVFPERLQEFDLVTATSLAADIDAQDPMGATGSLRFSASGTVPTTSQARSLHLSASVSPAHARLEGLRVLGDQGEARVELFGGLSLREDVPLGFDLEDLPMAWLEALGVPHTAVDTLHLRLRGRLGALAAKPGERLADVLQRLGGETPRQRLDDLRGELRVEELSAREDAVDVVRLKAPLVVQLDERGLVILPASLDLQGHELEIGGTLTSEPEAGSEVKIRSAQVPLRSLLMVFLEDVPEDMKGVLDGTAQVKGPLQAPSFLGALSLVGLDLRLPYLESRLRGEVRVRANGGGLHVEAPGLAIDSVPVSLAMSLATSGPTAGEPKARVSTRGLLLRRGRSRVGPIDGDLDGSVDLATRTGRLVGAVDVKGGTLVLDDYGPMGILREVLAQQRSAGASPESSEAVAPPPSTREAGAPPSVEGHELDLRVRLSTPLLVRSPLVDASIVGEASVQKQAGVPLFVEGEAQLRRGSVFLHRHEFKIVEGRVELRLAGGFFTSSLRALAEANVAQHRIRLEVRGSLDEPQVTWRSTPARTESEITHLLATGRLPGQGGALSGAAQGVAEFFATSSLNRMLSSSLGLSSVRVRRDGGVSRFDVDKQLDHRTVVTYSRGTDNSDRLSVERRVGGTTTVEGGRKRDQEGARPFVGIKRRLRFR